MKRPNEAIERMRAWGAHIYLDDSRRGDILAILAYLDAWPADLDKARMLELAPDLDRVGRTTAADALRRLAELAPVREKRRVSLYEFLGQSHLQTQHGEIVCFDEGKPQPSGFPWRKVGGPFEIEEGR